MGSILMSLVGRDLRRLRTRERQEALAELRGMLVEKARLRRDLAAEKAALEKRIAGLDNEIKNVQNLMHDLDQ
ncbi:hypothetical protein GS982_01460 [Rhodococcus hoagii]|uniref:Uncharacterized protein n=1 Tax=Rhodococcus hoagii TaxID=43767 RepID=A0A9Q5EWP8_RHOHA|nr:hypothetical protein [Prescottella equi]NKT77266.1 hypothetical protein [Prescottella equi]NKZ81051.1 hypothetical protein [Prescottella equi]